MADVRRGLGWIVAATLVATAAACGTTDEKTAATSGATSVAVDTTPAAESGLAVWCNDVPKLKADEVEKVDVSTLQAAGEKASTKLAEAGIDVVSLGVVFEANRVTIGLVEPTDETRRVIAELFPGDEVCVEGGPPTPPPARPADYPTTILPPEGSDPLVTCFGDSPAFHLSALDNPPTLAPDDPVLLAIQEAEPDWTMSAPSATAWRYIVRTDDFALFEAPAGPMAPIDAATGEPVLDSKVHVEVELEDGQWTITGSSSGGSCVPVAVLPDGLTAVGWGFDPAYPAPQPGDTSLRLLVRNVDCSGGAPVLDRLVEPEVEERGDQLLVGLAAESLAPGAHSCQGTMGEPYELALPEPLGSQVIVDGRVFPPKPAEVSSEF